MEEYPTSDSLSGQTLHTLEGIQVYQDMPFAYYPPANTTVYVGNLSHQTTGLRL
jgi:hypothetical protein